MKKKFLTPVMHVVEITTDVICSSSCPDDIGGYFCSEDMSCLEDL